MKNLIRLTKINALTIFDFYKIKNARDKKELKKELPKFLLIIFAFIYLGYFVYRFAKMTLTGLIMMNLTNVLLPAFMAITSAYILFMTIFKVNKTIFDSKDYSILLSLPIKKNTIISSKIILLYLINIIYSLLFLMPAYIAYISLLKASFMFHLTFWLSFFFIPIVPTVIGALIGTILTGFSSKFKYKNFASIILSLLFMTGIMYLSYASNSLTSEDIASISTNILSFFNKIYPLAILYNNLLLGKVLSLILFLAINILFYEGFKYFVVLLFDKINSNLKSVSIVNKYNEKKNKIHTGLYSLFKKEIKRYFSSSIYVLNTGVGAILLTIATIALVIMGPSKLGSMLEIEDLSKMIGSILPIMLSVFCALTCTTYPSISLEGKNLWILKSLPIKTSNIFIAKILVNLVISVPMVIINGIILTLYLHLSLTTFLLVLFIPVMYAIFIAGFGLFVNVLMPDFEWTSEVKVIKQSYASLITIFIGLIMAIVPMTIDVSMNSNLYSLLIGILILIINVILYCLLFTKGKKKFEVL